MIEVQAPRTEVLLRFSCTVDRGRTENISSDSMTLADCFHFGAANCASEQIGRSILAEGMIYTKVVLRPSKAVL
jgi:hypothetical protein